MRIAKGYRSRMETLEAWRFGSGPHWPAQMSVRGSGSSKGVRPVKLAPGAGRQSKLRSNQVYEAILGPFLLCNEVIDASPIYTTNSVNTLCTSSGRHNPLGVLGLSILGSSQGRVARTLTSIPSSVAVEIRALAQCNDSERSAPLPGKWLQRHLVPLPHYIPQDPSLPRLKSGRSALNSPLNPWGLFDSTLRLEESMLSTRNRSRLFGTNEPIQIIVRIEIRALEAKVDILWSG
ncbi:hypothetical protein C8R44DRAFT_848497, partial [Mycena epipterygia]